MITKKDLKRLAELRLKDSACLLESKRYQAAQYLAGYSVELYLKLNICNFFNLIDGYPEDKYELEKYTHLVKDKFKNAVKSIGLKTFKTHNLNELLLISGKEYYIKNLYLNEWTGVLSWSPEMRYNFKATDKLKAERFLKWIKQILKVLKTSNEKK